MSENCSCDEYVARQVLDGDKEAFGYFIDKYSDHVFNITIRYTRNRRDALDVTQDVFVQAYRSLGEVKDYSLLEGWFAKIAVNLALNWVRGRKLLPLLVDDISRCADDNQLREKGKPLDFTDGERNMVWKAIRQLPENLRTLVVMKYMGGCSYAGISRQLGISVAAVRTRLARAKQMMKPSLVPDSSQSSAQHIA